MLHADAGEQNNTGSYPSAPMCVITLRVFVSKPGTPHHNIVTAPQSVSTPLIQINVPKAPEKVTLPVRSTQQAQTPEHIRSGSNPKQWNPPPAGPVVAPSVPESVPAAPPQDHQGPESTSRRSSIRRVAQQPSSNGSRSSKKVHFSISGSEDSLDSPESDPSLLDPAPPVVLPSDPKAMAVEDKPTAQAPPSGEHDEGEPESDFSSDIDDGEMVQHAVMRGSQGDNDHLYRMDWGDLDSDSGSAVDGSEPVLSVPIKRDVTSRPSFTQPLVSNDGGKSSAPSGHPAYLIPGEQPENAIRRLETNSPLSSGPYVPAERRPASSFRQPMQSVDWENDSVVGSMIDDYVPAVRAPLTSYKLGNERPISLHSAKPPFPTSGASDSALQGVKRHDKAFITGHATVNAPSKSPTHAAVGSPQTHPRPIFVHRRRERRTHDVGLDGTFEDDADGNANSQFRRHPQDFIPCSSQQMTCEVHYDRRTGTVAYEGLRDGYVYVTKARGF